MGIGPIFNYAILNFNLFYTYKKNYFLINLILKEKYEIVYYKK